MFAGEVVASSVDISTSTDRAKSELKRYFEHPVIETVHLNYILLLKLRRIDRVGGTDRKTVEWTQSFLEAVSARTGPFPEVQAITGWPDSLLHQHWHSFPRQKAR